MIIATRRTLVVVFVAVLQLFSQGNGGGSGRGAPCPSLALDGQFNREAPVALVDGELTTLTELDSGLAGEIQSLNEKLYQLRRSALERRIDRILLERVPRDSGMSPSEWLKANVPPTEVTDEEVEKAYDSAGADIGQLDEFEARTLMRTRLERARKRAAYRKTLLELRQGASVEILLERPAVCPAPVVDADDPVMGTRDSSITLVEFADFRCGHCRRAHQDIKKILKGYGDRIRFVYKALPGVCDPGARKAAEAALLRLRAGTVLAVSRPAVCTVGSGHTGEADPVCCQAWSGSGTLRGLHGIGCGGRKARTESSRRHRPRSPGDSDVFPERPDLSGQTACRGV